MKIFQPRNALLTCAALVAALPLSVLASTVPPASVPEPGSLSMFGMAIAAAVIIARIGRDK